MYLLVCTKSGKTHRSHNLIFSIESATSKRVGTVNGTKSFKTYRTRATNHRSYLVAAPLGFQAKN